MGDLVLTLALILTKCELSKKKTGNSCDATYTSAVAYVKGQYPTYASSAYTISCKATNENGYMITECIPS